MSVALYHRALACQKTKEAEVFRKWVVGKLKPPPAMIRAVSEEARFNRKRS